MINFRENIFFYVLAASFILQYNFLFSANYLWLNYWSGSDIRTVVSFIGIFFCLLLFLFDGFIRFKLWSVYFVLLFYFFYGFIMGGVQNDFNSGMVAEGIFWLEIILYFLLLSNASTALVFKLVKFIVVYSSINAIFSIVYYWFIIDQIAVAAIVNSQKVVRIADLLNPLILLLLILNNKMFKQNSISFIWCFPFILLVLLGMFRSVWAAFIFAYIISLFLYPTYSSLKKSLLHSLCLIFGVLFFEYIFELIFEVDSVIIGRIFAGVGSEDSLGRISSSKAVLNQLFDNNFNLLFGAGFGKWVWFVNDFGDGEVLALQPLGSLSNYFVVLLYQLGIFITFLFCLYLIYCFLWIRKTYNYDVARTITLVFLYFIIQWLTFPTTIHYPVALIIAFYFTLTVRKLYN